MAAFFPEDDAVEATIGAPIRLREALPISASAAGLESERTGDPPSLIMTARTIELTAPDVRSPAAGAARVAAKTYRGEDDHVLPHCFLCGSARKPWDGPRIFPDWVKDPGG